MPTTPSLKIGSSGARGIVGEFLTPQLVTSLAAAFGSYCGAGPILIGSDTRPTREMLTQATIAGLLSVGCTPIDLGIVPVPSLVHHIRRTHAFGGICISASHNPIEWNALKFIGSDGISLRPNQAAELTDLYHQGVYTRVAAHEIPDVRRDDDAVRAHRDAILETVTVEAIRRRSFRVAVDCCNGAAYLATPEFLRALGCDVVSLHTDPNAAFPHDPEPLPENLGRLCEVVRESAADVGFAQDADADRLAIVNERGAPLGEDCSVALAVHRILERQRGPVVVNASTSRMVDDIAAVHRCPVFRTPVGEAHVVERMLECGAVVGGEGNGGVIVPSVNPCRDSFVGMALVLEALAQSGSTMSQLRGRLPHYAMVREKLVCDVRDIAPSLRLLQALFRAATLEYTDGLKAVWPDRWIHIRPSKTEPVLRLFAEAPTEAEARTLVNQALECLSPTY